MLSFSLRLALLLRLLHRLHNPRRSSTASVPLPASHNLSGPPNDPSTPQPTRTDQHTRLQETASLEHETFALRQKAAITADVKAVLDSWVRHEAQVREAEQRELVASVLSSVQTQLADKKLQREILLASVAEIESEFASCAGGKGGS